MSNHRKALSISAFLLAAALTFSGCGAGSSDPAPAASDAPDAPAPAVSSAPAGTGDTAPAGLYCSVSPIPFATMTNREWGQIGNNYLKSLFAIGFQGFLIMICVGIYAVLVNNMIIADNLHSAIFSLAAYTVILCFSLFKSGALAKSIFSAH